MSYFRFYFVPLGKLNNSDSDPIGLDSDPLDSTHTRIGSRPDRLYPDSDPIGLDPDPIDSTQITIQLGWAQTR